MAGRPRAFCSLLLKCFHRVQGADRGGLPPERKGSDFPFIYFLPSSSRKKWEGPEFFGPRTTLPPHPPPPLPLYPHPANVEFALISGLAPGLVSVCECDGGGESRRSCPFYAPRPHARVLPAARSPSNALSQRKRGGGVFLCVFHLFLQMGTLARRTKLVVDVVDWFHWFCRWSW